MDGPGWWPSRSLDGAADGLQPPVLGGQFLAISMRSQLSNCLIPPHKYIDSDTEEGGKRAQRKLLVVACASHCHCAPKSCTGRWSVDRDRAMLTLPSRLSYCWAMRVTRQRSTHPLVGMATAVLLITQWVPTRCRPVAYAAVLNMIKVPIIDRLWSFLATLSCHARFFSSHRFFN